MALFSSYPTFADNLHHAPEHFFNRKLCGVYDDGVVRDAQRRVVARGVAPVALVDVGERILERLRAFARALLVESAARALFGHSREEELHVRRGEDDRADVATVEDAAAPLAHLALATHNVATH